MSFPYQFLIRQVLRANELQQRVSEQKWVLAVVAPELHLIEIRGKVTGAHVEKASAAGRRSSR